MVFSEMVPHPYGRIHCIPQSGMVILTTASVKEDGQGIFFTRLRSGRGIEHVFSTFLLLPGPLGKTLVVNLMGMDLKWQEQYQYQSDDGLGCMHGT
jgi:hypothetical protein